MTARGNEAALLLRRICCAAGVHCWHKSGVLLPRIDMSGIGAKRTYPGCRLAFGAIDRSQYRQFAVNASPPGVLRRWRRARSKGREYRLA